MKHSYLIPRVSIIRPRWQIWLSGVSLLLAVLVIRHVWFIMSWGKYRPLGVLWMMYFIVTALQWGVAWLERPFEVDTEAQKELDRWRVTVSVPVFNEDPEVLDRVLYGLFNQTRLPDRVGVVDDGSRDRLRRGEVMVAAELPTAGGVHLGPSAECGEEAGAGADI